MKQFTKYLTVLASVALLASCSMFKLDNYDGPNASIHGRLIDAKTGELVKMNRISTVQEQLRKLGSPLEIPQQPPVTVKKK